MAQGKRQLEILRWEDNIRVDIKRDWRAWASLILFMLGAIAGLL